MDPVRRALLDDIDAWMAAAGELERTLAANHELVTKGREMVAQQMCLTDSIGTLSTTARYLSMNDALANFDIARFALRSSLIKAALAEGLTGRELVELLGVPPELTARILEELGRGDPPEPHPTV